MKAVKKKKNFFKKKKKKKTEPKTDTGVLVKKTKVIKKRKQ